MTRPADTASLFVASGTAAETPAVLRPVFPRLPGIDALRGILACSVMLYHYLTWTAVPLGTAGTRTLHAIGLYAVEAFFVISGMSLFFAYRQTDFTARGAVATFSIRRMFRIAPLFYLVLLATLSIKAAAIYLLRDRTLAMPGTGQLLGNVSLLFGLWDPSESLVIAGWSIGIEMTFYLLFPAIAWILQRDDRRTTGILCGLCAACGTAFAFGLLSAAQPMNGQWGIYVNVANHLPLFVAGMLLAKEFATRAPLSRWTTDLTLVAGAALFVLLSATTPAEVAFVSGWRRVAFSLLTVGLVWVVARRPESEGKVTRVGRRLGDESYAIYLTHFLHFTVLQQLLPRQRPLLLIAASLLSTLVTSRYVFRWIETPMIATGKRVAQRLSAPRESATAPEVRRAA